jgi:hypothetical protein
MRNESFSVDLDGGRVNLCAKLPEAFFAVSADLSGWSTGGRRGVGGRPKNPLEIDQVAAGGDAFHVDACGKIASTLVIPTKEE